MKQEDKNFIVLAWKLNIWLFKLMFVLPIKYAYKGIVWAFNKNKENKHFKQNKLTKLDKLPKKQRDSMRQLFENAGFKEILDDGSYELPFVGKIAEKYYITLLSSQHPEQVEKYLRGISNILERDFIGIVKDNKNVYKFIEYMLPDFVSYESDRPLEFEGLWLGYDELGKAVGVDFKDSPVGVVVGASGSGKSVLVLNMMREIKRKYPSCRITIIDGKDGMDWSFLPIGKYFDKLITSIDEAADFYESIVNEEMPRISALLKEQHARNYKEYDGDFPMNFIFLDEASDFIVKPRKGDKDEKAKYRIIDSIEAMGRKSRAYGLFQVISQQAPQSDSFPTDIKNNIGFKICYKLSNASQSQSFLNSGIAADDSLRNGKGVLSVDGNIGIFRGAFIDVKPYQDAARALSREQAVEGVA